VLRVLRRLVSSPSSFQKWRRANRDEGMAGVSPPSGRSSNFSIVFWSARTRGRSHALLSSLHPEIYDLLRREKLFNLLVDFGKATHKKYHSLIFFSKILKRCVIWLSPKIYTVFHSKYLLFIQDVKSKNKFQHSQASFI